MFPRHRFFFVTCILSLLICNGSSGFQAIVESTDSLKYYFNDFFYQKINLSDKSKNHLYKTS